MARNPYASYESPDHQRQPVTSEYTRSVPNIGSSKTKIVITGTVTEQFYFIYGSGENATSILVIVGKDASHLSLTTLGAKSVSGTISGHVLTLTVGRYAKVVVKSNAPFTTATDS